MSTGITARLLALLGRIFERDRCRRVGQGVGECAGISGVAARKGLSLDLIAVEQSRRRDPFKYVSELPTEVHGILDCGVVAEAARWGEQMRGIAGEQYAP